MTIIYPLTMPIEPWPRSAVPELQFVNSRQISPYTKQQTRRRWSGEIWVVDLNLPPLTRDEAEEWISFLMELRGSYGSFLMTLPDAFDLRGAGGGAPLVKGGGQLGYTLEIDSAPQSLTNWLKKGDYFQIGTGEASEIKKLTRDISTDSGGNATLHFVPAIRFAPEDNSAVVITGGETLPNGCFSMENHNVNWSIGLSMEYGLNLRALEFIS